MKEKYGNETAAKYQKKNKSKEKNKKRILN